MIHPELKEGEIFLGYYEEILAERYMDFETKRIGQIVIGQDGKKLAIDEDGNIFRQDQDFPVFVQLSEMEADGMDMGWFFILNPMIAAFNGIFPPQEDEKIKQWREFCENLKRMFSFN